MIQALPRPTGAGPVISGSMHCKADGYAAGAEKNFYTDGTD